MNKAMKKTLAVLSLLLALSYGLTMASTGVSVPGCTDGGP